MSVELYVILALLMVAALYFVVPYVIGTYLRYRGKRVVTCPETRKPVGVEVDAGHAALSAAVSHPDLRLKSCTRWPERQNCGQECLSQIELSPEDCLLRNILKDWYRGRKCVSCGKPFGELHFLDHEPALLSPVGKTVEWSAVAPEEVAALLATHFPVCWDCHITETFCREHPEMIVDRSHISEGIPRELIN
jgi:hypothetical protein